MYLQTPQLLQDDFLNKNNFVAILEVGRYPEIVVSWPLVSQLPELVLNTEERA